MTDTPSTILLTREQSTGSNTNLWGSYLITTQRQTEQAAKGYQSLAVTGDATISWTLYATGNVGSCARLKLTGALTANATLTLPNYMNRTSVENATAGGFSVTIKCSGGTGVTITNGDKAEIYCDGVDYYNSAATLIGAKLTSVTAGTAGTDAVNLSQMAAAIAASVPAGTAGTFLNSIADTTRGFFTDKYVARGLLRVATLNAGGNEQTVVETTGYTATGPDTYAITVPLVVAYVAGETYLVTFTNANTTAPTLNVNGLGAKAITKNGATALDRGDIAAGAQRFVTYDGTQFQISGTSAPSPGASEGLFMSTNFSNWG